MEMLIKSDKRLYRAYLLKERLRLVFKYTYDGAGDELDRWLAWAQRCRIKEFVELGKKIKRHKVAILATNEAAPRPKGRGIRLSYVFFPSPQAAGN